jgi:plastocyanin
MSTRRVVIVLGPVLVAVLAAHAHPTSAADGTIQGTVKVTGLASNADAVVYVVQAAGPAAPSNKPAEIDQRNMQFVPHVLPIVAGTTVRFLNSDPTAHNVFSPDHEKYDLGTWSQGQSKTHAFATCTKPPCVYVQLCRIHPEMEAYVVVLQNPFFAVTAADGRYKIDNVPPGSYSLGVWHAKGKAQPKPAAVDAAKPAVVDFVMGK